MPQGVGVQVPPRAFFEMGSRSSRDGWLVKQIGWGLTAVCTYETILSFPSRRSRLFPRCSPYPVLGAALRHPSAGTSSTGGAVKSLGLRRP